MGFPDWVYFVIRKLRLRDIHTSISDKMLIVRRERVRG